MSQFLKVDLVLREFLEIFGGGQRNLQIFFVPGKINLIGEHTSYNGGLSLSGAINLGSYIVIRKNTTTKMRFASFGHNLVHEHNLNDEIKHVGAEWVNYPLGALVELEKAGFELQGFDCFFYSDLPMDIGLASSASLVMAAAYAISDVLDFHLSKSELISICFNSEKEFIGKESSLLDYYTISYAEKDCAMLVDCSDWSFEHEKVNLIDYRFVITDSKKRPKNVKQRLSRRKSQCKEALVQYQEIKKIEKLCEINYKEFEDFSHEKIDKINFKRAKHIITENDRVKAAVEAMVENKFDVFGKLMFESHYSLKNYYEVSSSELDILIDEGAKVEGVIGSKMLGSGFGGCVLNLIHYKFLNYYYAHILNIYRAKTGLKPDFYEVELGDSLQKIYE